jgi:REP element-mobilizing transposase RayT
MQYSLFPKKEEKRITIHGGDTRKGMRKTRRPIAVKRPMHVILKSKKAVGNLSFLTRPNARFIGDLLTQLSVTYAVNIKVFSNVGNHLHLAVRAKNRQGFQNFLRELGSKIAIKLTGAKKGLAIGKFWTQSAYTRIVEEGPDFWNVIQYILGQGVAAWGSRENLLSTARSSGAASP